MFVSGSQVLEQPPLLGSAMRGTRLGKKKADIWLGIALSMYEVYVSSSDAYLHGGNMSGEQAQRASGYREIFHVYVQVCKPDRQVSRGIPSPSLPALSPLVGCKTLPCRAIVACHGPRRRPRALRT